MFWIPFLMVCLGCLDAPGRAHSAAKQHEGQPSQAQAEPSCWPRRPEVITADPTPRKLPALPRQLTGLEVKQFSVALKVCIDEKGQVARTLVLRSSGNREVDAFFQAATAKWKFKPAQQGGKAVPSVLRVSTTWNPQF